MRVRPSVGTFGTDCAKLRAPKGADVSMRGMNQAVIWQESVAKSRRGGEFIWIVMSTLEPITNDDSGKHHRRRGVFNQKTVRFEEPGHNCSETNYLMMTEKER